MKRLFELFILGLLISVALYLALQHDPGYVRISFGNWIVESNLYVFATVNVLLVVVTYWLLTGFARAKHVPRNIARWMGASKGNKAIQKTNQGLLAFLEGNWGDAAKLLKRSADQSATPIVNYLAAAHAENEQGNTREADLLLQKAYSKTNDSDFAVGIAKAQMELEQNQLESCLATLIRLKQKKPGHPFVLKLLRNVYIKLEDWQQLIHLIPELKKQPNSDKQKLKELEEQAWRSLFTKKADELKKSQKIELAGEELSALWRQLPDSIRFEEGVILNYAEQLLKLNNETEAEALVRTVLNKNWNDRLIEKYGTIRGKDPAEQLIYAESWLKSRPNNPQLLMTLGRLSLQNELWGKALEYFEASNTLQANRECLAELCRLRHYLSNQDKDDNFENLIATLSLPSLPMPKRGKTG